MGHVWSPVVLNTNTQSWQWASMTHVNKPIQSKLISEKPYMEVLFPGCDDRSSSADFYEITKDGIVLPLNGWHQIIKGS